VRMPRMNNLSDHGSQSVLILGKIEGLLAFVQRILPSNAKIRAFGAWFCETDKGTFFKRVAI
jgi:hypothetical protein